MFVVFCAGIFLLIGNSGELEVGEPCVTKDKPGKCTVIHECAHARDLLSKNERPDHCSFTGYLPVVCCPEQVSERLISKSPPGNISALHCRINHPSGASLAYGGTKAAPRDYIHMALIGYGDITKPQWRCGGSIITVDFILTAAHCAKTRDLGPASIVRLGDLNWASDQDDAAPSNFPVIQIIIHPEYKPPKRYNDIALLKITKIPALTVHIGTACLAITDPHPSQQFIATGWGRTSFTSNFSADLIEVELKLVDINDCGKFYQDIPLKNLPNGLSRERQLCAGDVGKDTCQGDSGGPLQYAQFTLARYYVVFGITSFGKACGITDTPGVYTRVPFYIEWLESVIWPNGPDFLLPID